MCDRTRILDCWACQGDGNRYLPSDDPADRYFAPCTVCGGSCEIEVKLDPVTLEDLENEDDEMPPLHAILDGPPGVYF